jgi:hypothetical protein
MKLNGFGRKRSWPNFKVLYRYSSELEKTTKNISQNSRSPGPNLNSGRPHIRSRNVNHSNTTFGHSEGCVIVE